MLAQASIKKKQKKQYSDRPSVKFGGLPTGNKEYFCFGPMDILVMCFDYASISCGAVDWLQN